jgi:hypothetical protein
MLSWMRDLTVDLYPGAPPSVQIRGKPATDPLNRGISQHKSKFTSLDDSSIYLQNFEEKLLYDIYKFVSHFLARQFELYRLLLC